MRHHLEPSWDSRELPILRAALRRLDAGKDAAEFADIREETGLVDDQIWAGMKALESADPPYIERIGSDIWGVSERARRELGTWPTPEALVDQLAAALTEAAEAEREPENKTRLMAAAQVLGGMAKDVAVGVLVRYVPGP